MHNQNEPSFFADVTLLPENAIVRQDGPEFTVIPHVRSVPTDKIVKKNVLAKTGPLVITLQVKYVILIVTKPLLPSKVKFC